jgi:hypothetical protein
VCPTCQKGAKLLASPLWHSTVLRSLRIPVSLILSTPCVDALTKPTLAVEMPYVLQDDRCRMLGKTGDASRSSATVARLGFHRALQASCDQPFLAVAMASNGK